MVQRVARQLTVVCRRRNDQPWLLEAVEEADQYHQCT